MDSQASVSRPDKVRHWRAPIITRKGKRTVPKAMPPV